MPDQRAHRGPHPEDARLFGEAALPALRRAAHDYCWLLNRDYPTASAVALVGNRYRLDRRQRNAVSRYACSDAQRAARQSRRLPLSQLAGEPLMLDGFNVLTTVEAALAGGVVLAGRDGAHRDLAGMHGTYRKVEETVPALRLIGRTLAAWNVGTCRWYLDSPVSNSGRLKTATLELAAQNGWNWEVELVPDPDTVLKRALTPIATADSAVLDKCGCWVNLARAAIESHVPGAWVVELASTPAME